MTSNPVIRTLSIVLLLGVTGLALTACKIEHKAEADQKAGASAAGSFENTSFDPKAEVAAMWDSQAHSGPRQDGGRLPGPENRDAEQPGRRPAHNTVTGKRATADRGTWRSVSTGKVVAAETELSAGTADIDVDGDGKADVQVQIGPVIRGTAIRDAMPFISFTNYTNQIDFAQLANAFNDHAYEGALKDVDRSKLIGQQVELRGVFTADGSDDMPVITVIAFKVVAMSAAPGRSQASAHRAAGRSTVSATPEADGLHPVVLRLEGVSKVYPGTMALKSVDFDLRAGAVNVLVGENGAGKSTMMKIIAGVEQPSEGRILLDGKPVQLGSTEQASAQRHRHRVPGTQPVPQHEHRREPVHRPGSDHALGCH